MRPGSAGWRWLPRLTQALVLIVLVAAPLLGGWQRLDEEELAAWNTDGRELPAAIYDQLPRGRAPRRAYEALVAVGGGSSIQVVGVAALDPLAGGLALFGGRTGAWFWLAVALPIVLGLLFGRVFCGWLCPFGTLSRWLDAVLRRLRWRRFIAVPARRPLRYGLLIGALAVGVLGGQLALYLLLPHVLAQQAVYAAWLLGGGSAALGLLGGLLVAGVVFGPTTWCAALCPTGAALGVLGRARVAAVRIDKVNRCGSRCGLCDVGCWLHLNPASGDPGPDCDLCARCFSACPKVNLSIGLRSRRPRLAGVLLVAALPLLAPADGRADASERAARRLRPQLVLSGERVISPNHTVVAVGAVDLTGVRNDADAVRTEQGVELSVFVARGALPEPPANGILPSRDWYAGALAVEVRTAEGLLRQRLSFTHPRRPWSARRPTIFRERLPLRLDAGDRVVVMPVKGWFDEEVAFAVPRAGGIGWLETVTWLVAGALLYGGLCALALGVGAVRWTTFPFGEAKVESGNT